MLKERAVAILNSINVSTKLDAYNIDHLDAIHNFCAQQSEIPSRVVVYSILEERIVHIHPKPASNHIQIFADQDVINIFLIYVNNTLISPTTQLGHYMSCRSLKALDPSCSKSLCNKCLVFYPRNCQHKCKFLCNCGDFISRCRNQESFVGENECNVLPNVLSSDIPKVKCSKCLHWFWNNICLDKHIFNGMCEKFQVKNSIEIEKDACKYSQSKKCHICKAFIAAKKQDDHVCFIQRPVQKKATKVFYCYFDFETTPKPDSNDFISTLCCAIIHCEKCWRGQISADAESEENH